MDDAATGFACFPLSSSCFSTLLHSSNRKVNVMSEQEDQVSSEVQTEQTMSKKQYVSQDMEFLRDQLRGRDEEIHKSDVEIRELKSKVSQLTVELDWLLSDSGSDQLWIRQNNTRDEAGASSKVGNSNSHRCVELLDVVASLRTTYSNIDERDIMGAHATPFDVDEPDDEKPWKQPRPYEVLPLTLSYTEIYRSLLGKGLINPQPPLSFEELALYGRIVSRDHTCEYHDGSPGHSTENCIQLRLQLRKFIRDGVVKIEPPKLIAGPNK